MLDSFLTFINQYAISLRGQRCLLTVSGGIDSVVLANLFYKSGIQSVVAHCNFGLRGEESEGDELFVQELSAQYGFSFYVKHFEIKSYAKSEGISTQMAARTLRYAWFESLRQELALDWIVTGHHLDDVLETTLLNLTRGTGIAGLPGIAPVHGALLRPLINSSREEIMQYALENKLVWRNDSSNDSDAYHRNKIRHHVVPVMKGVNPSLQSTFLQTANRLRSATALIKELLEAWKTAAVRIEKGKIKISIYQLTTASENVYRLWWVLNEVGFTYVQSQQIISSLEFSGKTFISQSHILLVDRDDLIVKKKENSSQTLEVHINDVEAEYLAGKWSISIKRQENPAGEIGRTSHTLYIPWNKLIFPLHVRRWKEGDRFAPLGMGGKTKKVSDLLTDMKVDRFAKEEVFVLVNGNADIMWIMGFRSDERYKMSEQTSEAAVIRILEHTSNF
ncbi:tRNA lysidine(34) synthetase TilS [Dyadobacter sandarakinus]|uniref:tRNA(Ile)-lysidine synthase n=1 Tax=Dyadobacter sandarakinus TaxID=2747268 RepID=A0ABX7I631_9BACT|nr:tRNA lysidine(34) synthetase TilS [Dyadobacter sandarakinus]QRR01561.1 tRNA lysidine(34) synthetase TilS [Dyadobacter sandarakinus]